MKGKLYINGYDAYETWGVILEEGSYDKLLTAGSMKPYVVNESRNIDGELVSIKNPRVEPQDITLTFCLVNHSISLLTRLKSFINTLKEGKKTYDTQSNESVLSAIYTFSGYGLSYNGVPTNTLEYGSLVKKYDISGKTKARISGRNYDSVFCLYCFYDNNDVLISYGEVGTNKVYSDFDVLIPQNAKYIQISGSLSNPPACKGIIETYSNFKYFPLELKVPELNSTYRLIYQANTSVSQINLSLAKVSVKFREPNPANRTL